jgi:hypothetical protein
LGQIQPEIFRLVEPQDFLESSQIEGGFSEMLFGHNSNVPVGADTVHVQTEDRGAAHAVIDTTVHWKGRVLHRRTNKYSDLLPLDSEKEAALKNRIDEQHRAVIDEIRSGSLHLALQSPPVAPKPATAAAIKIELANPKSWLAGKTAALQLVVRDAATHPVAGADVRARVDGAAQPAEFSGKTNQEGAVEIHFVMPSLAGHDAALVIEAAAGTAKSSLRFQLRAKAKT